MRTLPQATVTALAGRSTTPGWLQLLRSPRPSWPFCQCNRGASEHVCKIRGSRSRTHLTPSPRPEAALGVNCSAVASSRPRSHEHDVHVLQRAQHVRHAQVVWILRRAVQRGECRAATRCGLFFTASAPSERLPSGQVSPNQCRQRQELGQRKAMPWRQGRGAVIAEERASAYPGIAD